MNKEETYYNIKKLITEYSKRTQECSRQWDELNEKNGNSQENTSFICESMNSLVNEMQIYENFIEELKSLMRD